MKIVLGGKFESAYVRLHDEEAGNGRNQTSHRYYMDLNRNTDKIFRDGAATFVALSEKTFIPWELDWGTTEFSERCGIDRTPQEKQDSTWEKHYDTMEDLIDAFKKSELISLSTKYYATNIDLNGYSDDVQRNYFNSKDGESDEFLGSYIRRLLHQIYASRSEGAYLLVAENDIKLLAEIGKFLKSGQFPHRIDFPDLTEKIINPEDFLDGILNFSPADIKSIEAVRKDKDIRAYASRISNEIEKNDISFINQAAIEAYNQAEIRKRAKKVFEVVRWIAKPLHYIPGFDAIVSVAEDINDVVDEFERRKNTYRDWYMIGVRMQTVSIEDFLRRKNNQ